MELLTVVELYIYIYILYRHGRIDEALKRLHSNLGHPSQKELFNYSGSLGIVVRPTVQYNIASLLQCSVCENQRQPAPSLPANASMVKEFNERFGLMLSIFQGGSRVRRFLVFTW